MTVETGITVDLSELEGLGERWEEFADWTRSNKGDAERLALKAAQVLVGAIREEILSSPAPSRGTGVRTGALARSYREQVKVSNWTFRIGAFSHLVYAGIQDRGGRIYPRTRKALAIPMTRKAAIRWPRDWPRGKLFRPRGKSYLASAKGKHGIEVQYLLRKSVRIKPKHYLRDASKVALPQIGKLFVKRIADGVTE